MPDEKEDGGYMSDNVIRVAVWGEGSLLASLWPHFQSLEQQGVLNVVAIAKEQQGKVVFALKEQNTTRGGTIQRYFCAGSQGLLADCRKTDSGRYSP